MPCSSVAIASLACPPSPGPDPAPRRPWTLGAGCAGCGLDRPIARSASSRLCSRRPSSSSASDWTAEPSTRMMAGAASLRAPGRGLRREVQLAGDVCRVTQARRARWRRTARVRPSRAPRPAARRRAHLHGSPVAEQSPDQGTADSTDRRPSGSGPWSANPSSDCTCRASPASSPKRAAIQAAVTSSSGPRRSGLLPERLQPGRGRSEPDRRRRTSASWPGSAGQPRHGRPAARRCVIASAMSPFVAVPAARRARAAPRCRSPCRASSSLRATAANRWWKRNQRRSPSRGPGTGSAAPGRRGSRPSRSCRATASHSGAQKRSRIDMVRMKLASRSVPWLSTSSSEVAGDEPVVPAPAVARARRRPPDRSATGPRGRRRPASPRSGP